MLILHFSIAQGQKSIEQIAIDYFFDEIFVKDFNDEETIKFESTIKPYDEEKGMFELLKKSYIEVLYSKSLAVGKLLS